MTSNKNIDSNYFKQISNQFPHRSANALKVKYYKLLNGYKNRNRNENKNKNKNNKLLRWNKSEENKLIAWTKDKQRNEIDWENILFKFPNRTMDAIKSKHWELCVAKNQKIKTVATRFSYRISKNKNLS